MKFKRAAREFRMLMGAMGYDRNHNIITDPKRFALVCQSIAKVIDKNEDKEATKTRTGHS